MNAWSRLPFLALGLVVVAGVGLATWTVALSQAQMAPLQVALTAAGTETTATFTVNISNPGTQDATDVNLRLPLPEGTSFQESWAGLPGLQPGTLTTGALTWAIPRVSAGTTAGPYVLVVSRTAAQDLKTAAQVAWTSPMVGATTSPPAEAPPAVTELPRRGCPACHSVVNPQTGQFSLYWEAQQAVKAEGGTHPSQTRDGSIVLGNDTMVETCLVCHQPGTGDREGKGARAPYSLRDITHPVHMGSPIFAGELKGNCFSCHNVDGQGNFQLLTRKVDVHGGGVPNQVPIPGAVPIDYDH